VETVCPLARAILINATLLVADDILTVPNVMVNVPFRATLAAISAPLPHPSLPLPPAPVCLIIAVVLFVATCCNACNIIAALVEENIP
jgi:hypothetical protein